MLRKIDRILIRVPNLPAAVSYYVGTLGLEIIKQTPRLATLRLIDDAAEIVLHSDPNLPEAGVYFLVDSVQAMYDRRDELKLTFISAPTMSSRGLSATVRDPFGTVMNLLDRSKGHSAAVEDVAFDQTLFAGVEPRTTPKRAVLIKLYERIGLTADDLPYTPQFEQLYESYISAVGGPAPARAEVWRHLLNLRKGGKLPKLGEARSRPPTLEPESRARLKELLKSDLGKRDRLPYTQRFDELVDEFNRTLPRALSPHLIWRAVATLAK